MTDTTEARQSIEFLYSECKAHGAGVARMMALGALNELGDQLIAAHERIAELEAENERLRVEREEAHRTAGKALEDVRLEREVHVKATELLKDKVRKLEAERASRQQEAYDAVQEFGDIAIPTDDLKALVRAAAGGLIPVPSRAALDPTTTREKLEGLL